MVPLIRQRATHFTVSRRFALRLSIGSSRVLSISAHAQAGKEADRPGFAYEEFGDQREDE
jgi:hypothetical protein